MSFAISAVALLSAALVLMHPTRWAAAGALLLNAVASGHGWCVFISIENRPWLRQTRAFPVAGDADISSE
jgi:hypothetical protein